MQLSEGTAQRLVDQLDRAQDIASEAQILRRIKNNVTGHELRKIAYIRAGLVPALSELLTARSVSPSDDSRFHTFLPNEEAIWWHASSVVMVLASAGTAFTHALIDGNLLSLLVNQLRTTDPAERVAFSLIQSLNTIATNLPMDYGKGWTEDQSLSKILYTPDNAAYLTSFAATALDNLQAQQRLETVLMLICTTCRSEKHVAILVESGLFEVLCHHLATYISAQTHREHGQHTGGLAAGSRLRSSSLAFILETIALIIQDSESRARDFAMHDAIERALLMTMGTSDTIRRLAPTGALPADVDFDEQQLAYDFPLPLVPDLHSIYLAKRSTWPPLSDSTNFATASRRQLLGKAHESESSIPERSWLDPEEDRLRNTAIVPWLLSVARSIERRTRTVAARLLVIFKSHQMLNGRTMRSLSTLLVPILVDMLEKQPDLARNPSSCAEHVPAILALLVRDQEYLQQAAVEAKAIPKLTAALKASFEGVQDSSLDLWWPTKLQEKLTVGFRDRSLGLGGPSRTMRLQMLMREGLLQALAALAPDSDVFRKDICDQGALNHIIMALEPFHAHTVSGQYCDRIAMVGNSSEALVAACCAVRALTRSPTSLRTKLVDADVVKHIIKLLYTPEPAVRVAATMVVANLSHGFSPMKSSIADTAVIKKLCEQAHSANAQLRRETLFALKAFINLSANKVKRMVVEELGINWIRHLIATDPCDVPSGEVIGLVEKDYRKGSKVRISDDADMIDAAPVEVEEASDDYNRHTLEQDLDIQAELLGFLRNLTTGENPLEIIDYVLEEIGCDEFFQIIVDRLKAGAVNHARLVGKIIQNCIYIVAHLAVADSKYRSMIARNLILMKQVDAFLGHPDPLIRRACCWLVINVIYSTTESHAVAVSRAKDLQRLGIVAHLRRMEKNDLDTDVKERASTACDVFSKLLESA